MKTLKLKQKVALAIIVCGFLYCLCYCLIVGDARYSFLSYYVRTDCGVVTSNFTELHNIKHGTRTDYYLRVKYPNHDKIQRVAAETFMSRGVGSNICFDVTERIPPLICIIAMLGLAVVAVYSVGHFIIWILD